MNGAHAHLIVNHVPVISVIIGIGFLIIGILRRRDIIIKSALWIFLGTAAAAIVTFLTGDPAEHIVRQLPGISEALIEPHCELAEKAFISAIILGLLSLAALVVYHKKAALPAWLLVITVVWSLLVGVLMAWTANRGGMIHHPEIRSSFTPAETAPAEAPAEDDD
jgi:uncharacterized membrane protein